MRLLNYVIAAMAMLCVVACEKPMEDKNVYPTLETLDNTMWYSYDQKTNTYYDIWYDGEGRGRMLGYDTQERENETVNRPFDYTFEPANDIQEAFFHNRGRLFSKIHYPLAAKG